MDKKRRKYNLKIPFIQWVLFFFIYCFFGWIWETTYVSLKTKRFTNRGFLNGPLLPIYGFGSVAILFVTIPVQFSNILIFMVGMIAATVLEFLTGVAMEAIFKVRYWDYSTQKFNYKGHICLKSSIAWGFGTLFITKTVQVPIVAFVCEIPSIIQETITVILCIAASCDMAFSIRDALDVKEILMNIKQNNEEIQRIQKRLDVLIAVMDDETKNLKQKLEQLVENRQEEETGYVGRTLENMKKRLEVVEHVAVQFEWKVKGIQRDEIRQEFEVLKEKFIISMIKRDPRKLNIGKHATKLLKRNPNAVSKEYAKELKEVQGCTEKLENE